MDKVVAYYVGLFLRIFSGLLLLPVAVGLFFGESFIVLEGFIIASFVAILSGVFLIFGENGKPDAVQGMLAAVIGWICAVAIGSIPFMHVLDMGFVNAFFESMSGFTTTGISLIRSMEYAPKSLVFWRAFIQWIGGLGILTFFVAVIVKVGGAATALATAEADKTDSGKIRPSVINSIKSMWYVYIVFTLLQISLLYLGGLKPFEALNYALTTLPTGGYSHTIGGIAGFGSVFVNSVFVIFMFIGGTNFLLLYRLTKGNLSAFLEDFEFKLYVKIILVVFTIISLDIFINQGGSIVSAAGDSIFHTVSVASSTGFELRSISSFPEVSKMLLIGLMFVGGCLGSTTGGVKMYRLGILLKIVWREVKSFTLPRSALNFVSEGGEKLKNDVVFRIVAIFFLWFSIVFIGGLITVMFSGLGILESIQGILSSISSMGPLLMSQETLIALPPGIKLLWSFIMLAGRLELLPILVFLNVEILKRFS